MDPELIVIAKEIGSAATEFQLLPYGEVEIEGEQPAYVDGEGAAGIIAAFERRGNDMVIDYEHQTLKDVQAPAAGWIKRLVNRGADGIWAVVEWTKRAQEYIGNREYRYFSPVMWIEKTGRRVLKIDNVALTNFPRINNLKPIIAKMREERSIIERLDKLRENINTENFRQEAKMDKKLLKLLGLAEDAGEDKVMEAVTAIVAKNKELEGMVACKEVLAALELNEGSDRVAVIAKIDAIKTPGNVAVELSQKVAELTRTINGMKRDDLVALALKDGKTSPDELDKWGRDLAEKSPEQFEKIVLSRPTGSVIPIGDAPKGDSKRENRLDEVQLSVNKMMGIDEETFKKYGPKEN